MKATDTRIALKNGAALRFYNRDNGLVTYTIQDEIGRGGSCIVYNASYTDNSGGRKRVRIKECYPFKLNILREDSGELVPDKEDISDFEMCKTDIKEDFKICAELFETKGLTNSVLNTIDIYESNNTVYIVSAYAEGKILSEAAKYTLKEMIEAVKGTASVIRKIHERGYLYLDVKPENIFVYEGAKGLVQLFDFGSLIPMQCDDKGKYNISYTEGFAAAEQKSGQIKRIGKHSDVYSVGALLFYLLFDRTPRYLDCEQKAVYDFSVSKLNENLLSYNDKLFPALTDFFHNTLASYYLDRYGSMEQVVSKLEEIEKYSDTTVPYIISTKINRPQFFTGRSNELRRLDDWFNREENIIFISGMGGIGKSSLVCEYLAENRSRFDTVLYLCFHNSIKASITDDGQVHINTVQKDESETIDDYFKRKLSALRRLVHGTESVIVIDNYSGIDNDIADIYNVGWKVVVVTRQRPPAGYKAMLISAIAERENLYLLFENGLKRSISLDEKSPLNNIIDKVKGHTLILELIAKQTAGSYLSVTKAERLIDKHGFTDFAPEKVEHFKDNILYNGAVSKIVAAIFDSGHFSRRKKSILKMLSLFDFSGINAITFAKILALETKDEINELIKDGWVENNGILILLHPVIKEVAAKWEWTDYFKFVATKSIDFILSKIKTEKETRYYLSLGENIIKGCENEPDLYNSESYKKLLCQTVINSPLYREDYIIRYAESCLSDRDILSSAEVLKLYDLLVAVYEKRGNFKSAFETIKKSKEYVTAHSSEYNWGIYYDMLAGYYDEKLNGCYDALEREQRKCLKSLLNASEKSIEHMKRASGDDSRQRLAGFYVGKANILIRSGAGDAKAIKNLLVQTGKIINESLRFAPENIAYLMACAWYFTYIETDFENSAKVMKKACKLVNNVFSNDLDIIDNSVIPCANIFLEHGKYRQSEELLLKSIDICERYDDIIPYLRKKMELYSYLLDIYRIEGNEEGYKRTAMLIDSEKMADIIG